MRDDLILPAKVRAFRADPEVAEALRAPRVGQLAEPPWPPATAPWCRWP